MFKIIDQISQPVKSLKFGRVGKFGVRLRSRSLSKTGAGAEVAAAVGRDRLKLEFFLRRLKVHKGSADWRNKLCESVSFPVRQFEPELPAIRPDP